jgi:scyllo-inositol 2-dehydrogenase (NADP+)
MASHETIRAGVVGFGLAGRVFHAAVLSATPGYELAAIVQRTGDEAAHAYPSACICRSVDELLSDESIQLVAVATPNPSHFPIARQCLEAGRAVIVDKPFTLTSEEAAELIELARAKNLLLTAYQNRRWDGDFLTIRQLLASGELGRIVRFESRFDRFRLERRPGAWREDPALGGGILYDLGPHVIDQALTLFGPPRSLWAEVRSERDSVTTDDSFDLLLNYPRMSITLHATMTATAPGPRFNINGVGGTYLKFGLDPQEDAIKRGDKIGSEHWGEEPESDWGTLTLASGEKRRIPTLPGDYRGIYANIRDALLGKAALAVTAHDAWRTARIIELARESSATGHRLPVDLTNLP